MEKLIYIMLLPKMQSESSRKFMKKKFAVKFVPPIFALPKTEWPVGQSVKTPPFHGGMRGSIPLRATYKRLKSNTDNGFSLFVFSGRRVYWYFFGPYGLRFVLPWRSIKLLNSRGYIKKLSSERSQLWKYGYFQGEMKVGCDIP